MPGNTQPSDIVIQVVRGERPWNALQEVGIDIAFQSGRCFIDNTAHVEATAQAHDVAQGLIAYQDNPSALRTWAWILLAGSPFLELALEQHHAGEVLLEALWDASFGQPLSEYAKAVSAQLARETGSR